MNGMAKALFLDRDGVVIVEEGYLCEPDRVKLIPGAADAMRMAREAGYLLIMVSNQSGVARGKFGLADVEQVNMRLSEMLAVYGAAFDAVYYCPHHPDITGPCDCRKPAPGMLLRAQKEFNIDMKDSAMVGDRPGDVQAGVNAGCGRCMLVRTGYGMQAEKDGLTDGMEIFNDLSAAVSALVDIKTD